MILIIGIGSHSEVVEDIFLSQGTTDIFFASVGNVTCTKSNYLGDVYSVPNLHLYECVVGIGDNKTRYETVKSLEPLSLTYTNAIHKTVYLSKSVQIGVGNVLCAGVSVGTSVIIENHSILNTNSSIDHHCIIKDVVHVAPNCGLCGNVCVQTGSFIGVGSNIIPNVSIKPWSFIKAHTLVKEGADKIAIYQPYLETCTKSITDAVQTGWISSQGPYLKKAADRLRERLRAKHVLLVSNGTVATHCLFLALKYKYPHIRKIYVPNNVYVAAINAALMEYPFETLQLLPIDEKTFNMLTDLDDIEKGSAVLVIHNVGNPVNVPRLKRLRPDLVFVEDNCEGLFGMYEGMYTGIGDHVLCSSVSFFANKTITCGEGGAVFTHDSDVYEYLSRKINQGVTSTRYLHDMHAYNYRMTNLQAALLYDQLNIADEILTRKHRIFERYRTALSEFAYFPAREEHTVPAEWIVCIRIPSSTYEATEKYMHDHGIEIRPFFYPLNAHAHLSAFPPNEIANRIHRETFMIPSHPSLLPNEQDYIIDVLKTYVKNI
jgi:perosamine synthetase